MTHPSISLQAPAEFEPTLEPLLPGLAEHGVERLEVFTYGRPGEPLYLLAFMFCYGRRFSLGTPDQRDQPLETQLWDLVRQLLAFSPKESTLMF